MRTKRILSLVLAIAMLASLTISASAASKVYYAEDFSGCTTVDEALAAMFVNSGNTYSSATTSKVIADMTSQNKNILVYKGNAQPMSSAYSSLDTDSSGVNWFKLRTTLTSAPSNEAFNVVPNNTWDYTSATGMNETYVISYDIKVAPGGQTATREFLVESLWTNGAETATNATDRVFAVRAMYSNGAVTDYAAVRSYKAGTSSYNNAPNMNKDTVYKMAVGYKYATDAQGTALTYPYKTVAVNGAVTSESTGAGATSATPILGGFRFNGSNQAHALVGESITNIRMYTIDNSEGAFNVSSTVSGEVASSTVSVPVEFSQPVYASSFVPANVTVTKTNASGTTELVYGTDFTVSAVEDVVGAVGAEIYSTATVTFTDDLDASSEYTITFPETITNEIATPLGGTYNKVTFHTPTPDVTVKNFVITKNWEDTDADAFDAANTLQGAALTLKNNTDAAINNIAVIYAVYASGKLTDVVYANGSIEAGKTTEIGAGVTLSTELAGGKVKAFVWDGISSLKPHTGATEKNIVAVVE